MRKHGRNSRDYLANILSFFEVGERSEVGVLEKPQNATVPSKGPLLKTRGSRSKVLLFFESTKIKMPFMRISHKWQMILRF